MVGFFFSIFITVVGISAISTPLITEKIRSVFIEIQTDVNNRNAKNIAAFIENKVATGTTLTEALQDVQVLIANSESDRGYACVVDSNTGTYLNHPNLQVIGMNVTVKQANFTALNQSVLKQPFEQTILDKISREGVLHYPMMQNLEEAVSTHPLEKLGITVSTHENIARLQTELDTLSQNTFYIALLIAFIVAIAVTLVARKVSKRYEDKIEQEKDKNEQLLLNVLPKSVVEEVKQKGSFTPRKYDAVSILFFDIVGFTGLSSAMSPTELVSILNTVFKATDKLIDKYQAEKIKTIGDAYMICSGAPVENKNHARDTLLLAQDICEKIKQINQKLGLALDIRIGINSGPIVAGIIGKTKFSFDLWGDTVNIASRMESHGLAGRVQVSEVVYQQLNTQFDFEEHSEIEIKGKGLMKTYLLK